MRSDDEQQDPLNSSAHREFRILTEVAESQDLTQRQLSLKVGIALGLTNVLLRNLIQKGYLRVSKASWKRRIYNLTPEGVSHKLRLTKGYISRVLDHYQNVRMTLKEQMEDLNVNKESRIAVFGTNEFAELVFLGLKEMGIEEIKIFDHNPESSKDMVFLGMPVQEPSNINAGDYDKIVVASLSDSESRHSMLLRQGVPPEKVVTFFNVSHPN